MSEWHAIRKTDSRTGGNFFEWRGESFFATEADLDAAIAAWRKTVTPAMAARTIFLKHVTEE